MSAVFELVDACVRYGGRVALEIERWSAEEGQLIAVAGPNGAGKSTLLALLAGLRRDYSGECLYRGRPLQEWKSREYARTVTFLPQQVSLPFPFTAEQVVLMGRAPHSHGLFDSPDDLEAAARALEATDTLQFRDRDFRTLSGGEKQRVILAAALAQEPRVLLLDEPATFLDLKHQAAIFELLRRQARQGVLVIAVTHDLNLARHYADRLTVLAAGRVRLEGTPREVIQPGLIREVFETEVPWIRYDEQARN